MTWIRIVCVSTCIVLLAPRQARAAQPIPQGCGPELIQTLQSPVPQVAVGFGDQVAMSDRHLATLVPFALRNGFLIVYQRADDPHAPWVLEQTILLEGSHPGNLSAAALALDGDTLVVGTPSDDQAGIGAGAVLVYRRTAATATPWQLEQKVFAPDANHGDFFGRGVDVQGDELVVGAWMESSLGLWSGAAYCFERQVGSSVEWVFRQKLLPSSVQAAGDFGVAVDLDGDTLAIGAPRSSVAALQGGAIFVFEQLHGEWVESQVLVPPDVEEAGLFGGTLAISGEWLIAASALDNDLAPKAGAVQVFRQLDGSWTHHQKVFAETGAANDLFGACIAADGDTFHVGTPFVHDAGPDSGAVYSFAFEEAADVWLQTGHLRPPGLGPYDNMCDVAARDGLVAAGAPKSFEWGAVHVFSVRATQNVTSYCTSTSGTLPDCAPMLDTLGAPSASQGSTFRIWSRHVPGAKSGVMLYSPGGPARADLGASGVCIPGSGLRRKGLFWSGGTFGACDGSFHLDWNDFLDDLAPADALLVTPGATVNVQVAWFDPLVPDTPAWSDALAFQLCP